MTEELLQRYFVSQTTLEEARQVLDWFDTEAGQAYLAHRLDTQLSPTDWPLSASDPMPDANRLWHRLYQTVHHTDLEQEPTVRRLNWYATPMRWAAVLIGALLVALSSYWGYRQLYPDDLIRNTAYGTTSKLTLPDGSMVTLNGNSRLRYAPRWAYGQVREVWLDGEAFFRVTHQPHHERFLVHLPNKLTIEVLGTQFNVLARQSRARVVLSNGKIRLDVGQQSTERLVMLPGDLFFADVKTNVFYRKRVDPAVQSSWQEGKLRFDGTTLGEVAQMLEETYGVTIVIADTTLQKQAISGTIPNKNLNIILKGLSTLFDLHIVRQANQITIQ
ncbi:FecR family protein [Spirosoma utsteinense]|uniref:Ferric-dicitrate binding protein FerR (Iron transport regulator) n=1 Tax=Spirosoma utsteinense TaxID=2585773 RepID=A0ABR6W4X8_9BACT|nr:FecR domain-containing protein [Spirosoma utsteinense]MBC3785449.1 ferric-dicitrate binding protein FerR (iron transport regulator) [Spirosoma utsteinense]MBC3791522.1 ferric-dicitrate binding protein FerR (iron transport regulator) [Spirosoma utsteinense]